MGSKTEKILIAIRRWCKKCGKGWTTPLNGKCVERDCPLFRYRNGVIHERKKKAVAGDFE